jgi:ATP-dependent RNA helicase DHX57
MPKNAHPPRGKPAKKTVPPEEDTSYIVFGDGKPKKKKPDNSNAGTGSEDPKGKGKAAAGQAEDGPKKPDTRTLIAGASWTGKLPVNLLSEHFQKQHWSKPDYRIVCTVYTVRRLLADLYSAKMARGILRMRLSCRR